MAISTVLDLHHPQKRCVAVLLTDDDGIRRLNLEWRGKDKATDVLSWPAPDVPGDHLGDIAISINMAERQAAQRQVSISEEVAMLGIHGGLHLLGFDDLTETDYKLMQAKMREAALAAGLSMKGEWGSFGESS